MSDEEIAALEAERNELARQLGAEIARCQEWINKWSLATARADAAEARVKDLERRLAELGRQ